jgi:iron-sulfur cluster repair protein YtfE (RIC family)
MDPTKMLEADHRQVEEMLGRVKQTEGPERAKLVDQMAAALLAHMVLEERIVYPALLEVTGNEAVEEALNEHQVAKTALDDLIALSPDEPGLGAALDALEAAITHHVKDEETEVFPKMRADGAQELTEIATPFMQKRIELDMDMPAEGLAQAFSKDELAAEAKLAGIDDFATMKKEELADALSRRMAS